MRSTHGTSEHVVGGEGSLGSADGRHGFGQSQWRWQHANLAPAAHESAGNQQGGRQNRTMSESLPKSFWLETVVEVEEWAALTAGSWRFIICPIIATRSR